MSSFTRDSQRGGPNVEERTSEALNHISAQEKGTSRIWRVFDRVQRNAFHFHSLVNYVSRGGGTLCGQNAIFRMEKEVFLVHDLCLLIWVSLPELYICCEKQMWPWQLQRKSQTLQCPSSLSTELQQMWLLSIWCLLSSRFFKWFSNVQDPLISARKTSIFVVGSREMEKSLVDDQGCSVFRVTLFLNPSVSVCGRAHNIQFKRQLLTPCTHPQTLLQWLP